MFEAVFFLLLFQASGINFFNTGEAISILLLFHDTIITFQ